MKKLIICLGVGLLLANAPEAKAQQSLHDPKQRASHLAHLRPSAINHIGLRHYALPELYWEGNVADEPYLELLGSYLEAGRDAESALDAFLDEHADQIDQERARLLLGLYYLRAGQEADALAQLQSLKHEALYAEESDQAHLIEAYLLLRGAGGEHNLRRSQDILSHLNKRDNIWTEQARLYESYLLWNSGKPELAIKKLEEREWSEQLLPEVEYLGALMSYDVDSPTAALQNTRKLLGSYPEMKTRPRLVGQMARAYYQAGDYPEVVRQLQRLQDRFPEDSYLLGAAYYQQQRYQEALSPLQEATEGEGLVAPLAQFALANSYQALGKTREAQLALERTLTLPDCPASVREEAHYQLIEIVFTGGHDAFGQGVRLAEQFIAAYPKSAHRHRVFELVGKYLSESTDYATSLAIIDRLERQGARLAPNRQEVLLRSAIALGAQQANYMTRLSEAIALGNQQTESYPIALILRAEQYLQHGRPHEAEADVRQAVTMRSGQTYQAGVAYYLLGYALYNQKKYREAIKPLDAYASGQFGSLDLGRRGDAQLQSDAALRSGDCQLQNNEPPEALRRYQQADQLSPRGNDEALYRIAGIYAKWGKYAEQVATIDRVAKEHPQSPYLPQLLYERGRAELLRGHSAQALASFAEVEQRYPTSSIAATSALHIALIYSNADKEQEALSAYRHVIERYPESQEAESALADLKSLYAEQHRLDEYAAYVRSLGGKLRPNPEDEAHLQFLALESRVKRGESSVTGELETYLRTYPKAADRHRAERLLAAQYAKAGRLEEARSMLARAREGATGETALALALEEADLLSSMGKQAEAYTLYHATYQGALGTKHYSLEAGMKAVRNTPSGRHTEGLSIVREILKRQDLSTDLRHEAILWQGRLEELSGALQSAQATYAQLASFTHSPYGAEAIVRKAGISLKLHQVKAAQQDLNAFIGSGSGQSYWLARAFILLSDSYAESGDRYLALQYLESLKENYTGSETDIHEMINSRISQYQSKP